MPKGVDGRRREWNYSDPRPASLRGRRPSAAVVRRRREKEARKEGLRCCAAQEEEAILSARARARRFWPSLMQGEKAAPKRSLMVEVKRFCLLFGILAYGPFGVLAETLIFG